MESVLLHEIMKICVFFCVCACVCLFTKRNSTYIEIGLHEVSSLNLQELFKCVFFHRILKLLKVLKIQTYR